MIFHFAWRNLTTRPLRTILGLVGLSIPVLGVLGLFSLSGGLRGLVTDTLGRIQGVMVVRQGAPTPVFSDLSADLGATLEKIPGVRVAAPEVWKVAPAVEGVAAFSLGGLAKGLWSKGPSKGFFDISVVVGEDIASHRRLKIAIGPKAILPPEQGGGRYLEPGDRGRPHVIISKRTAEMHRDAAGVPKRVGDTLRIGDKPFKIVGIYETKSMILDAVILMDIETARALLGVSEDTVSAYYLEMDDPSRMGQVAAAIEAAAPNVSAMRVSEFQAPYGAILGQLDTLLLMTVSLALAVGVVGIVNTMLMSTTERFVEFGVLRANGWSRADILALVTAESATLALMAGLLGSVLALAGIELANQFVGGGVRLPVTPGLFVTGLGLSTATGLLGGLYPAWRASQLAPMDAIRIGSR